MVCFLIKFTTLWTALETLCFRRKLNSRRLILKSMERSGIKPQGRRLARSGGVLLQATLVRTVNNHTGLFTVSLSPYLRSQNKSCRKVLQDFIVYIIIYKSNCYGVIWINIWRNINFM